MCCMACSKMQHKVAFCHKSVASGAHQRIVADHMATSTLQSRQGLDCAYRKGISGLLGRPSLDAARMVRHSTKKHSTEGGGSRAKLWRYRRFEVL